ncbi:CotH kinase family protein [Arcticibacterium luteifluviistationis]|uniref:LTD domain-containing protein n=1 Tax=Arcticibacterium luteifluviistationis TaxID=1784714 RepID=A0A2Z4GIA8_9BACT|nr:CotH kinase family protein [Arcticibacterium luteifluviistationis]AWW00564.1 hypothetical protein DJ013_21200 [Arcticibacterium luteifluviistationis]
MIRFTLFSLLLLFTKASFGQVSVFTYGSNWNYFDQGNVNNSTWADSTFDDSSWADGFGTLGYGFSSGINHEVSYGSSGTNKHITTYFRKKIEVWDDGPILVEMKVSSGAVFYLNGMEIYRYNLPAGSIEHNTTSSAYYSGLPTVSFLIPSNLFDIGSNQFAVEIHQYSATNSSMGFDCQMTQDLNYTASPKIYINEIMSSNGQTSVDDEGNSSDWIEIFNTTASSIDLEGYYFTDDPSDKTKFEIEESVIIPANSRLIFWANGKTNPEGTYLDLGLSSKGEHLALIAPDEVTIIDSVSFPALKTDISYGRRFDGDSIWRYFQPASFDNVNNPYQAFLGILEAPTFSHNGGFHSNPFNLVLSHEDSGIDILYTLDGSSPNYSHIEPKTYSYKMHYSSNSLLEGQMASQFYNGPIYIQDRSVEDNRISAIPTANKHVSINSYLPDYKVNKSSPVRAQAFKEGYISSEVVTNTFFVNGTGQNPYDIAVVSLNTNEDLLFEYDYGIHVNGSGFPNYFDTTEIPMSFEFIEDNSLTFSQNLGAKLHGGSSKEHPLKSFRLYARSEYDKNNSVDYPLFDDQSVPSLKRFILRNSGNDFSIDNPDRSLMFKDAFVHKSVKNLGFETQDYKPTVTYLNGEFWGILNLRERFDRFYFENKYGIEEEDLDLIKYLNEVKSGTLDNYHDLLDYFQNNNDFASNPARMAFAEANIDLDNYIDYQITQIFYNNLDWPPNNTMHWRMSNPAKISSEYGMDGKWRWVLFDTDYSMLNQNEKISDAKNEQLIFRRLMLNSDFQERFTLRYFDLLNTTYKTNRLLNMIDDMAENIENAIDDHIDRWRGVASMTEWQNSINEVKTFVTNRPSLERNVLKNMLAKSGLHEVTLNINSASKGFIKINTVDINENTEGINTTVYPWNGQYLNNLAIKLIAKPKLGYKFDHWQYNGQNLTDSIIYINSSTDYEVIAFFEDDFVSENPLPASKDLSNCLYSLEEWDSQSAEGTFPPNMVFVYMDEEEPEIDAEISGFTSGSYDHTSKTRINGLGENGISFVNTGSGQSGYEETSIGGAVLALSTIGYDSLTLEFTAGTVKSKSRAYNLRLEYRIGDKFSFSPFLHNNQELIYERSETNGHETNYSLSLPDTLLNQEYIQFFWRYYYTGIRHDAESGSRDEIRLDDISVKRVKHVNNSSFDSNTIENFDFIRLEDLTLQEPSVDVNANNAIILGVGFDSGETIFKAEIESCE